MDAFRGRVRGEMCRKALMVLAYRASLLHVVRERDALLLVAR